MRSADTTAIIAAALRDDTDRLNELLAELSTEDVARITDAGWRIATIASPELRRRLAERGRTA